MEGNAATPFFVMMPSPMEFQHQPSYPPYDTYKNAEVHTENVHPPPVSGTKMSNERQKFIKETEEKLFSLFRGFILFGIFIIVLFCIFEYLNDSTKVDPYVAIAPINKRLDAMNGLLQKNHDFNKSFLIDIDKNIWTLRDTAAAAEKDAGPRLPKKEGKDLHGYLETLYDHREDLEEEINKTAKKLESRHKKSWWKW